MVRKVAVTGPKTGPLGPLALPKSLQRGVAWSYPQDQNASEEGVLMEPDDKISDASPTRGELDALLRDARGNIKAIAEAKSWHRMQVYRWARRYGLDPKFYR